MLLHSFVMVPYGSIPAVAGNHFVQISFKTKVIAFRSWCAADSAFDIMASTLEAVFRNQSYHIFFITLHAELHSTGIILAYEHRDYAMALCSARIVSLWKESEMYKNLNKASMQQYCSARRWRDMYTPEVMDR